MNRRENLKLLFTGASGFLLAGCSVEESSVEEVPAPSGFSTAGRSPEEIAIDKKLLSETFFTEKEVEKLNYLVEVIIPADEDSGSALDAGVPDFIEFMVKDIPSYQTHMRGGLRWLDNRALDRFDQEFMDLSNDQRISIIDEIAYPDKAGPEVGNGVRFFNILRDLTSTGYFTSKMGFDDLGYVGNRPNVWDGVPEHVLEKYGVAYDPRLEDVYLKPDQRGVVAQWDDQGNLIG
ncbi:gluconate 2-dehydrogenase subunit 3 family protein [Litoribacter ruber]|uniref:Gluconate 2-dehydrogenase subunit 3 family protein n=1 Tax=Litoribacter ruber TaxID=702568 RepID=A0AAP2CHN9_9BACT|nr:MULTISPECIES: gluconate 2-dehydrogenase subunit 3 family protein [Litoribacter]MBS9524896.1 gluconate 2-dehydrogenase subunit 3 family protein [Litoribacter alkaliphilus]MBT0811943.1 gluconate 2-dehydrogenase subunit 3 family protein [Litoribacter ruber]